MKNYPNNSPGHYFTQLPQEIDLTGDYEVGLAEVQFPKKIKNVASGQVWISFQREGSRPRKAYLEGGHFSSVYFLVSRLNELIDELQRELLIKFVWQAEMKRVEIISAEENCIFQLSETLQQMLGLPLSIIEGKAHVIGNREPQHILQSVYIYCDLVSSRPVGDILAPLLRIIPLRNDTYSDVNHYIFEKPHYIPVSRQTFNTVEMLLTSDSGDEVPFISGVTIVTLHFRRTSIEEV